MEFSELNLHPDLQKGLNEAGYIECMPVQEQVLKKAFSGHDLYVQSQTGTGKTAAFLVVIFQRLLTEDMLHGKKAIIMVPTRELAVQVEEEAKVIGKFLPFKTGSFYGGVGYTQQTGLLRNNVQIMVGTPGRVLDLNHSGQMNLMDIAFLILDEADRMFDMGFYPDLRKLIRAVPPADRRQTMLFSATLNSWVKNLAWEYTKNPYEIAIEPETVTVEEVEQVLYHVSSADKMKLLLGIIKRENPESVLVFCNTKRYAEIVAKRLRLNGHECEFIMGDLPQVKRLKIIEGIKAGKLRLLVATDVAARGLDIEDLAMVINYDLPNEAENYVHRIGRTARAGKTGKAITLSSEQDVYELPAIERYIGRKIPSETAGADLLAEDKSEGKHIHTDYYEEPDSRSRRTDRKTREGGPGHKRGREERRGEHGRDERSRDERGKDERGKGRDAKTGRTEVNLQELSLAERMSYYRQKYSKGGGKSATGESGAPKGEAAKTGAPKDGAQGSGALKSGASKDGAAPASKKTARERPGKAKRGRNRYRGKEKTGAEKPENAAEKPSAPAESTPKKGLLSGLLGLFRKKKKPE